MARHSRDREEAQLKRVHSHRRKSLNGHDPVSPSASRTTRLTVSLSTELVNQLRDAVYWTPRLTLARVVEESIRSSLAQMESINRGPFPPRTQELKPGRPRAGSWTESLLHPSLSNASRQPQDPSIRVHQPIDPGCQEVQHECRL